ncbi:ComEC/Rec2 family competence protein [Pseudooceanicola sp. LIPI14-2-Ac024]|uniref:ComEC/Rec2 family competence protein n=1 Tax=Pseudooceanicola sp. LIPI14-2-Ac024 TaxID=3344875 RepID=UPI0035D13823
MGAGLAAQRGHLFPWVPVAFGAGIGGYFLLSGEPGPGMLTLMALLALVAAGLAARAGAGAGPLLWVAALVAAGLLAGALRSAWVAGPVLPFRYYGPVEGRVIGIDRSASDATRLTLDSVQLFRLGPGETPRRVRISLHGVLGLTRPEPGTVIATTAHLSPPEGPVEPGGFDFRRHAWFQGLGGVGYTRVPVVMMAPPAPGAARLFTLRMAMADRLRAALPGDTGEIAAAVLTGDRSGVSAGVNEVLRASNLAHLLAISGLHMGLLAGFVYAAIRLGLAAWPRVALRWPIHKAAALAALAAAAAYLGLSGGNVATERAFVMVAVALVALLFDRRALSLRAVALAAMIVLALRPEALLGPGFQMSFAATVALVAAFGVLRDRNGTRAPRWFAPVLALLISSSVAGIATAPVAAAHFNQVARLGLVANLAAVPVMGTLVMPAAVIAACLMPLGLEQPALWVMGAGIDWILLVAHTVADLPGAVRMVPTPPGAVLPLIAVGGLVICLWQGRLRLAGLGPVAAGFLLWMTAERPALLVAESGGLVGVMTAEGRALSRDRGSGFVARVWLENDGDPVDQPAAADRWDLVPPDLVHHVTRRKAAAGVVGCEGAAILVANAPLPAIDGCLVFDSTALGRSGAVAVWPAAGGWRVEGAAERARGRPWSGPAPKERPRLDGPAAQDIASQ